MRRKVEESDGTRGLPGIPFPALQLTGEIGHRSIASSAMTLRLSVSPVRLCGQLVMLSAERQTANHATTERANILTSRVY